MAASAFLFLASAADSAGECFYMYYNTANSYCAGGAQTFPVDVQSPAADAAACAAMCGCFPPSGSQWRYGCSFVPDPR